MHIIYQHLFFWTPNDKVSIFADLNGTFSLIQASQFGRIDAK